MTGVPAEARLRITVRPEGPATDSGHLPVAELARILSGLQLTLEQLALSLLEGADAVSERRLNYALEAVQLEFAGFGPEPVVLHLTGPDAPTDGDLLDRSLRALEDGISDLRRIGTLPRYFTAQAVSGLRELAGGIATGNLTSIRLDRPGRQRIVIDSELREHIRRISASTAGRRTTVVGRLLAGDVSPATLACRIDTVAGIVRADFGADLRDTVLNAMGRLVMAGGVAELQPDGSTVRVLHVSSLEGVPEGHAAPLAVLARQQGTQPVRNIDELRGDDKDDFGPFLDALNEARGRRP